MSQGNFGNIRVNNEENENRQYNTNQLPPAFSSGQPPQAPPFNLPNLNPISEEEYKEDPKVKSPGSTQDPSSALFSQPTTREEPETNSQMSSYNGNKKETKNGNTNNGGTSGGRRRKTRKSKKLQAKKRKDRKTNKKSRKSK